VAIATDGTPLPNGGTMTVLAHTPAINQRGEVAFSTEINGGAEFGLFRGDGKHLTTIFATNQTVAGVTLIDPGSPAINERGEVLAGCLIKDASGAAANGLFLGDGRRTVAVAIPGQPAPVGGTFAGQHLGSNGVLNDRGQVAFEAGLAGLASTEGFFRRNADSTTTIALQGAVAPGTNGATFASFSDFAMDEDGRVAFSASLTQGVGDTDTSNNQGIWMGSSQADLHLVVRSGQSIGGNALLAAQQLRIVEKAIAWIGLFPGNVRSVIVSNIGNDRE
jgi:hypothetical protein